MQILETLKMQGPGDKVIIVNKADVEQLKEKGFTPVGSQQTSSEPEPEFDAENLEELTVLKLRRIAELNNVDLAGLTKKPEIIDAIKKGALQESTESPDNPKE